MKERLLVATMTAIVAGVASAGVVNAALSPDATEVVLGTFGAALGVIAFLSVVYALKRALGLEKPLPPHEDSGAHH